MSNCQNSFAEWKFKLLLITYFKISKIGLQTKKRHLREVRAFSSVEKGLSSVGNYEQKYPLQPLFLCLTSRKCNFFVCKPILLIFNYVVNDSINFHSAKEFWQLDHFWRTYIICDLNFDIPHCGPPQWCTSWGVVQKISKPNIF